MQHSPLPQITSHAGIRPFPCKLHTRVLGAFYVCLSQGHKTLREVHGGHWLRMPATFLANGQHVPMDPPQARWPSSLNGQPGPASVPSFLPLIFHILGTKVTRLVLHLQPSMVTHGCHAIWEAKTRGSRATQDPVSKIKEIKKLFILVPHLHSIKHL